MRKLLAANFSRLWKDKVFWAGMIGMLVWGVILAYNKYNEALTFHIRSTPDSIVFLYNILIGVLSAVFCSLFIGTEYSDGTIRNKLIVGHKRKAIYLANLIVCSAASVLMCISFLAASCTMGTLLLGKFQMTFGAMVICTEISLIMVIACAAIFTMISMLIQNRAYASVVCILGIGALLIWATFIHAKLDAPEFYPAYSFSTDGEGGGVAEDDMQIPNPDFLRGDKRKAYEFLLDFLPTGQAIQIASQSGAGKWQQPVYSLVILTAAAGAGMTAFERKDIK